MVHDTKFALFFNPNFQWIYFLYGLSLQLLMVYLYRYSSDARAISMGFNMQRYRDNRRTLQAAFSAIELMTYCFSSNNTNRLCWKWTWNLNIKAIMGEGGGQQRGRGESSICQWPGNGDFQYKILRFWEKYGREMVFSTLDGAGN